MCKSLNFLVSQKGDLYFGIYLNSHHGIENGWKLKYVQYREAKWIDESEASLSIRIKPNDEFDENYYKSLILNRYPNRTALLKSITIGRGFNKSIAHYKAARFLVDNFDIILLPTFETQKMSMKNKRKLRKKSVRQMLTWAHYRFKQFLKFKAFETGKVVLDVNEAYTSKTNSWTGEIKNIGGREWIMVDGLRINRDINGARGIFLRALGDLPALKACVVNKN